MVRQFHSCFFNVFCTFFVTKMIYAHFFVANTINAHFFVAKMIWANFFVAKTIYALFLSLKEFAHTFFVAIMIYILFCRENDLLTLSGKFLRVESCHPESSDFFGLWSHHNQEGGHKKNLSCFVFCRKNWNFDFDLSELQSLSCQPCKNCF